MLPNRTTHHIYDGVLFGKTVILNIELYSQKSSVRDVRQCPIDTSASTSASLIYLSDYLSFVPPKYLIRFLFLDISVHLNLEGYTRIGDFRIR